MNGLGVLIVLAFAVVGCLSYRDYRIPIKGRRGSTYYATRPQKIVGDRHRNYKRGVNKTHPFELGIGVYYQMDIMLKPETDQNALDNGKFQFVPYTTESTFVTIGNSGTGCWSYVGRSLNNSYNQVNLQVPSCMTTGTVAHELMHALGFKHEFSRPDRDDWVSIDMGALAPEYQTSTNNNNNESSHYNHNYNRCYHDNDESSNNNHNYHRCYHNNDEGSYNDYHYNHNNYESSHYHYYCCYHNNDESSHDDYHDYYDNDEGSNNDHDNDEGSNNDYYGCYHDNDESSYDHNNYYESSNNDHDNYHKSANDNDESSRRGKRYPVDPD
ncbi:zinc metalloproteinase [Culex quinquefasciatus]|uniref:Metalloendopeptidase n=1 Tax=Culex quinquefasciatus TaxID=7176 RepID=B0X1H5_CULQU|nr:zinc metalloproteinase [Culex quinquefasciatus]|eukprot:XP_001863497.1 zinc metalloproteinase [Culex quinquefasciatus]